MVSKFKFFIRNKPSINYTWHPEKGVTSGNKETKVVKGVDGGGNEEVFKAGGVKKRLFMGLKWILAPIEILKMF